MPAYTLLYLIGSSKIFLQYWSIFLQTSRSSCLRLQKIFSVICLRPGLWKIISSIISNKFFIIFIGCNVSMPVSQEHIDYVVSLYSCFNDNTLGKKHAFKNIEPIHQPVTDRVLPRLIILPFPLRKIMDFFNAIFVSIYCGI